MKHKSLILVFLLGIIFTTSCSKSNATNGNVPDKVLEEFNNRYPGITDVHWDIVKTYHVARFNSPVAKTRAAENTYNTNAWFTEGGEYCQTDEDIDFKELPAIVQEAFNTYKTNFYPEWEVDDCEVLAREDMATIFVIEIESGDLEREISISESGDILKDVLDDDDEDEILPVSIPEEVHVALQEIFPETYSTISILELEIDDEEIEIDIIESDRHKEVVLDQEYQLVSIEFEVSLDEVRELMSDEIFQKLIELTQQVGIDIFNEEIQKDMEIEVLQTKTGYSFEIEIETDEIEFEIEIDEEGNFSVEEEE